MKKLVLGAALGGLLAYVVRSKRTLLARGRGEATPEYDDATLAHKVETEIFRDPEVPKGQINVNAEKGRVYLRGEASSTGMIDELVARTKKVHGVDEVENLLHLPGAEPQMHQ